MQTVDFETTLGTVRLWGRFDTFDRARPLLFVIRGAFPEKDHLLGLAEALPHIDTVFAHLPGMHSPHFAEPSIEGFAAAFDQVLAKAFLNRAIHLLGISMGGLVAMAMRHTRLRSIIALDTPLTTQALWPARAGVLTEAQRSPEFALWVWAIFGLSETSAENRDYRPLLDNLKVTTRVLVGAEPLHPERPLQRLPSLVSEADLAVYKAHPQIGVTMVGGAGHNIPRDGQAAMMNSIYRWLGQPPLNQAG